MGLFDFGGSGDPSGGLYGEFLTPAQKQALAFRGLQGFLGGMQKSGALDYTVPFISGKVPGGLAAGLSGGMAGMGAAQDEAAKNAMQAQLIGLQGQNLQSQIGARTSLNNAVDRYAPLMIGGGDGGAATTGTPAGSLDTVSPNSPGAFVKQHESEGLAAQLGIDPYHIGVGGADLSKAPKDENGFPIWEGHDGSHAAGAYQFQPATWAQYAKPLGIKDFSQASQDAVFRAAYLDQGYKPWAPYNPKIAAAVNSGAAPHAPASVQLASLNAAAPANDASINPALLAPTDPRYQQWAKGQVASGAMPQGADNPTPRFATDTPFQPAAAPAGVPAASPGGLFGMPAQPTGGLFGGSSPQATFSNLNVPRGALGTGGPSPGVPASMMPQPNTAAVAPAPGGGALQSGIDPRLALAAYLNSKAEIAGLGTPFKSFTDAIINSPSYKGAVAGAEAQGKLPYVGPTAAAEAQGKAPFTWNTLRPGQLGGYGGNMNVAAPTLQKVVDPVSGQESYRYIAPPVGPQSAAPGASADLGVAALGPGQRRALETRADKEQADRQQVITEANAAQQSRATLLNMQNETPDFYRGAGANKLQDLARYWRIIDPSSDRQVASYEDFVKNAGALTRNAVKEVSSHAAVQEFNLIGNSLPNPEMSPLGLQRVQNEMIGLTDYRLAKAQAQQQWEQAHGGPGNVTGFETYFQRAASPYAFIVAKMAPDDRREMFAKLQGSSDGQRELSRLGQQLTYLKQSGLAQ